MSDEGKVLLSRARSGMTPTARDRARMRARLLAGIGAVGVAGAGTAAASSSTATKIALAVLATLAVAGAGLFAATREPARAPSPAEATASASRPVEVVEPTRAPVVEPAIAPLVTPPELEGDEVAEVARPRAPRPTDPAPAERPTEHEGDSLSSETLLIARARAALRESDPAAALDALEEHARRHPHGNLAEERDILRIRAYCALGDEARASAAVLRFRRLHPDSIHAVTGCP